MVHLILEDTILTVYCDALPFILFVQDASPCGQNTKNHAAQTAQYNGCRNHHPQRFTCFSFDIFLQIPSPCKLTGATVLNVTRCNISELT